MEITIVSLVADYLTKCDEKGITKKTDNYKFDILINDEKFYTENISKDRIKQIMKTDKDITEFNYSGSGYYGDIHESLNIKDYTGYGVFNIKVKINDILIRNTQIDAYNNTCKSNDNSLEAGDITGGYNTAGENETYVHLYGKFGTGGAG